MKSSRLLPAASIEPLAADGDGDALGAAAGERLAHRLVVGVLAGADDQPAGKGVGADLQNVGRCRFDCHALPNLLAAKSSAADQRDDFQAVASSKHSVRVPGPRHQLQIHFDGDLRLGHVELAQQRGDRRPFGHLARLSVDFNLHGSPDLFPYQLLLLVADECRAELRTVEELDLVDLRFARCLKG